MNGHFEKPVPGTQIAGLARRKVSREKNSGGGGRGVAFFSSFLFFLSFFVCFVSFSPLLFAPYSLLISERLQQVKFRVQNINSTNATTTNRQVVLDLGVA